MINWFIGGGLVVGTCAWMAFGDEDPRWVRGGLKNLLMIAAFFGVMIITLWVLAAYGIIRS